FDAMTQFAGCDIGGRRMRLLDDCSGAGDIGCAPSWFDGPIAEPQIVAVLRVRDGRCEGYQDQADEQAERSR
ncbi:MAG TPA: hypothetical protein VH392_04655, partial [Sphingomicrobium sp.]